MVLTIVHDTPFVATGGEPWLREDDDAAAVVDSSTLLMADCCLVLVFLLLLLLHEDYSVERCKFGAHEARGNCGRVQERSTASTVRYTHAS
eukprot:TRINITY_DN18999_c0_g1_i1.p3 TRINITY_DN18999_c0_g1~~TRINITY_DN18999_c0_g1_i1.p3  ORF type:complete len:106 (+),score=9.18 TRINITY_DN18999_c0_g1_i1:47-319(+)